MGRRANHEKSCCPNFQVCSELSIWYHACSSLILSGCISPSVMLPENRLAVLLQQVKQNQIESCLYHTQASSPSLYSNHVCDRDDFPTEAVMGLSDLKGEVWQLQFSHDGTKLAGCGIKDNVIIWDTYDFGVVHRLGGHEGGVGNISWSPDDSLLVTCGQDKIARIWDAKVRKPQNMSEESVTDFNRLELYGESLRSLTSLSAAVYGHRTASPSC